MTPDDSTQLARLRRGTGDRDARRLGPPGPAARGARGRVVVVSAGADR
jgi:hypothetical protein